MGGSLFEPLLRVALCLLSLCFQLWQSKKLSRRKTNIRIVWIISVRAWKWNGHDLQLVFGDEWIYNTWIERGESDQHTSLLLNVFSSPLPLFRPFHSIFKVLGKVFNENILFHAHLFLPFSLFSSFPLILWGAGEGF